MAAVHNIGFLCGAPKVQPAEVTQTTMHARPTIALTERVISWSKNNFYDVIRLKILEVGIFQKNGQDWFGEKQTIEIDEITVNFKHGNK